MHYQQSTRDRIVTKEQLFYGHFFPSSVAQFDIKPVALNKSVLQWTLKWLVNSTSIHIEHIVYDVVEDCFYSYLLNFFFLLWNVRDWRGRLKTRNLNQKSSANVLTVPRALGPGNWAKLAINFWLQSGWRLDVLSHFLILQLNCCQSSVKWWQDIMWNNMY